MIPFPRCSFTGTDKKYISANSLESHIRGGPEGEFNPLPPAPVAKLLFGADKRDGNDMATPDDCHSGLGFGGIWLATCILELDFPVTLAARLGDGVSGMQLTPGSQHTAYTVPQPNSGLCVGTDFDGLQICSC